MCGAPEHLPLTNDLAAKIRPHFTPSGGDKSPLGRVTHKVARLFLADVMRGVVPDSRRLAYTAAQHAAALTVLEGGL